MFTLPDSWVWDFWLAEDHDTYHLFFLHASRALHDPDRRHLRAAIGHAVSTDLIHWEQVPDALVHGDPGEFDADRDLDRIGHQRTRRRHGSCSTPAPPKHPRDH